MNATIDHKNSLLGLLSSHLLDRASHLFSAYNPDFQSIFNKTKNREIFPAAWDAPKFSVDDFLIFREVSQEDVFTSRYVVCKVDEVVKIRKSPDCEYFSWNTVFFHVIWRGSCELVTKDLEDAADLVGLLRHHLEARSYMNIHLKGEIKQSYFASMWNGHKTFDMTQTTNTDAPFFELQDWVLIWDDKVLPDSNHRYIVGEVTNVQSVNDVVGFCFRTLWKGKDRI